MWGGLISLLLVELGCNKEHKKQAMSDVQVWLMGWGMTWQVFDSITYYRLQESSPHTEYNCSVLAGHCQVPEHAQGSYLWNQLRLWHMRLHGQLRDAAGAGCVSPDFLSILSPLFLLVIYSSASCPLDSCEAFCNSGCQETVYCLLTELSG
jgi:hypothetical protein